METTSPLMRLWKPIHVFWIGFFFGWPGAIVLATLNWLRAGRRDRAVFHIWGGLTAMLLYTLAIWFLPDNNRILPLLLNILILFYLKDRLDRDLPPFKEGLYRAEGIMRGILICVGVLLAYLMFVFILAFAVEMVSSILLIPEPPGDSGPSVHLLAGWSG